jgi:hypothetical protein
LRSRGSVDVIFLAPALYFCSVLVMRVDSCSGPWAVYGALSRRVSDTMQVVVARRVVTLKPEGCINPGSSARSSWVGNHPVRALMRKIRPAASSTLPSGALSRACKSSITIRTTSCAMRIRFSQLWFASISTVCGLPRRPAHCRPNEDVPRSRRSCRSRSANRNGLTRSTVAVAGARAHQSRFSEDL